ncbi:hypothetical protein CL1_0525 [Thermococcus cleftensis]|uniref:Uncharacterized protein n=1 Tax=Thermococcus cleftensis (strain DSM 27260 / KACC 17922 / CL1) TaxID=163003 RepID=I3ZSP9_THECF|nr:hypothetical protein [Thermococcus cleftensis]AFL94733.1 hypothetical protein CL1_0525 [Thermococcus cleftensis]
MALARLYLYDDKRSVFHTILGFASAFLLVYGLLVLVIYLVYEVREKEYPVATVGDVVEFLVGYVCGLAVVIWLALWFYT